MRSWRHCSRLAPPAPCRAALAKMIAARSEGNPFFAEELLAAASDAGGELPAACATCCCGVTRLDRRTQALLRVAAAADETSIPAALPGGGAAERDVRESLRRSVEHGVLVADPASGSFHFRRALLAEVNYATISAASARAARGSPSSSRAAQPRHRRSTASHRRRRGALQRRSPPRSKRPAAEEAFGLAEALAHLERALSWHHVRGRPSCWRRPRGNLLLGSRARQPSERRCGRSSWQGDRSTWSKSATRWARASTSVSVATCTKAAGPTPPSPHSSAWSSSSRHSHLPPSERRLGRAPTG